MVRQMHNESLEPFQRAKRIILKCNLLCQPLPINFELDDENKEVILLPVQDIYIEEIKIPTYITMIADWAFQNCHKLQKVEIPDSVKGIGEGAFHDCIRLQSIKLPDRVRVIPDQAFAGCISLEKIEFGSNIREIGNWAFSCSMITREMIPDTVESISELAFENY
jgi:hypothetical protein